jgi:hypothetical protein
MTMCIFGPISHEINFLEKTFIAATNSCKTKDTMEIDGFMETYFILRNKS